MDWIPKTDKAYTCSISQREKILKAQSDARLNGTRYNGRDCFGESTSRGISRSVHKGNGALDWVPDSERVSVANTRKEIGAGVSGRPKGIHNVHRGMDWIPNNEKRDPHAYTREQEEAGLLQPSHGSHGGADPKRGDEGFDWVPDADRATSSTDAIISGSLGGGWNAQFIIKRQSYRDLKKKGHGAKPYARPAPRQTSGGIVNKYNLQAGKGDVWSGDSDKKGPAPIWYGSGSSDPKAPPASAPASTLAPTTPARDDGPIIHNKYNVKIGGGDVWSGTSDKKGPAPLW